MTQAPATDWGDPVPPDPLTAPDRTAWRKGGAPPGPWGRPAQLAPRLAAEVIDLRERLPLTPPPPPPPAPTPVAAAPIVKRAPRWIEGAVAVLLLAGLAAVFRVHSPPPDWAARSGPALATLARDIAVHAPDTRLAADVQAVRRAGPPPAPAARKAWEQALAEVTAAERTTDAYQAGQDLGVAGLDILRVTNPEPTVPRSP